MAKITYHNINALQTFFKKMQNKFAGIKNMLYLCTAKQKKYKQIKL